MGGQEIHWLSALELIESYRKKELSPVEVTDALLARIESLNPKLNAIVTLTAETAREQAGRSERAYANGSPGALEGVPITIKDLIPVAGVRTTFGSRLYEDYVPDADAVLRGTILKETVAPLTYNTSTQQSSSFLITLVVSVTLTSRDGKVLYENKNYVFRQQYQATMDLPTFLQENPAAMERLSREFARQLVADLLEGF